MGTPNLKPTYVTGIDEEKGGSAPLYVAWNSWVCWRVISYRRNSESTRPAAAVLLPV